MYEEYRRKFAQAYHLSLEEATQYQVVKQYKKWLEEEYYVAIDEKVV